MMKALLVRAAIALALPCAFAIDGQVLINQSTLNAAGGTYTITVPGSYKLSGNLQAKDANTNVIVIASSNVTLDLNGFAILGPTDCSGGFPCVNPGTARGITTLDQNYLNITIRNGTIQGTGGGGIVLTGNSILVEYMHIQSTGSAVRLFGIGLAAGKNNQTVRHCNVSQNTSGIIIAEGIISDNVVSDTHAAGISLASGNVFNNTAMTSGFGLSLGPEAGYRGNTMLGNSASVVSGINLGQNLCDGVVCP